jgi:hypothetical protein
VDQPTWRSRARDRVASTISHNATAASDNRMKTNSATAISVSANLLPGVADDHKKAAASMAMVGNPLLGGITTFLSLACTTSSQRILNPRPS